MLLTATPVPACPPLPASSENKFLRITSTSFVTNTVARLGPRDGAIDSGRYIVITLPYLRRRIEMI